MKPWLRYLLPVLRYGLCVVAIWYLATHVPWTDKLTLNDANHTKVRMLEEHEGSYKIQDGRSPRMIPANEVLGADKGLPEIEYSIFTTVRRLDPWLATLSLLLFGPVPLLAALRLVWMLSIQNVHLPYWHSVKLTFAGNFFNFALPGTTGGDLLKAYWITHLTHHKTEAITTVFIDRVIGLLGLVMLATITFLISLRGLQWNAQLLGSVSTLLIGVWGGLIVGSVIVFSQRLRNLIRLPQLAAKLPGGEQILRVGRATVALRSHKTLILLSLLNTFALQLLFVVSSYFMARALNMQGAASLYFMSVPIGYLIAAIPIAPPQGFGIIETAFVMFFTTNGLNTVAQAVIFALATRVIQLLWALPGVLVPLLGMHVPKKAELQELEHDDDAAPAGAGATP